MHGLLEGYLEEVSAHLSALPTARRAEEVRELRAHLENAVTVNREMGQSEDAAARTALVQFGAPVPIAQDTVTAWRRGEARRKRDLGGAACCTVATLFLVGFLTTWLLLSPYLSHPMSEAQSATFRWVYLSAVLIGPVMSGMVSAAFFPRRAVSGAALGLAVWSCYWWGQLAVFCATHAHNFHSGPLFFVGHAVRNVETVATTLLVAWAVSRWRTTRTRRAMRARG